MTTPPTLTAVLTANPQFAQLHKYLVKHNLHGQNEPLPGLGLQSTTSADTPNLAAKQFDHME